MRLVQFRLNEKDRVGEHIWLNPGEVCTVTRGSDGSVVLLLSGGSVRLLDSMESVLRTLDGPDPVPTSPYDTGSSWWRRLFGR